jgi:hypothetical protein
LRGHFIFRYRHKNLKWVHYECTLRFFTKNFVEKFERFVLKNAQIAPQVFALKRRARLFWRAYTCDTRMWETKALRILIIFCFVALSSQPAFAAEAMRFFVTSVGMGKGGDLGGLSGADAHCQSLAEKAGQVGTTWRAYLSTQSVKNEESVNARDRIGSGPWANAKGEIIARSVDELHAPTNNINRQTALNERGEPTPGRFHDILTGTRSDGNAPSPLDSDATCRNWTSSAEAGGAWVGHHDRASAIAQPWASSWNSAHLSRGCSPAKLAELGSGGLFYCFALR